MKTSENFNHHLIHALDKIDSSQSKTEEIEETLIEDIDAIRSNIKTGIMDAYNKGWISALHVKGIFLYLNWRTTDAGSIQPNRHINTV